MFTGRVPPRPAADLPGAPVDVDDSRLGLRAAHVRVPRRPPYPHAGCRRGRRHHVHRRPAAPHRRVHHRLRRRHRGRAAHDPRGRRSARRTPHLGARRRAVRRGQGGRRAARRLVRAAAQLERGEGRERQPRAVDREGRPVRDLRRRLRARPRVPRRDGAVLRVLERRIRADAAGLRQPDDDHRPRCRLHADGVLPVRAARAEPVQRGLLRRHQRDLPTSASSTS